MKRKPFRGEHSRLAVLASSVLAGVGVMLLIASGAIAKQTAPTSKASSVVISTRSVSNLGTVLVNAKGLTLYIFVPDKRKSVTCVGGCAIAWPPLKLVAGAKPAAAGKVESKLLGSDPDHAFRVVTYDGWPLYTWLGDKSPGQATGQALNVNGGLWYVISPTGTVIHTKVSSGSTTSKTKASSDGCPPGETIAQASPSGDNDADNSAGGADDHDGCL